jgi:hypothetical protein
MLKDLLAAIENEPFTTINVPCRGRDEILPLVALLDGRGYIAGSYAAWMVTPVVNYEPADIDIFATTERNFFDISYALLIQWHMEIIQNSDNVYGLTPTEKSPIQKPIQVIKCHQNWKDLPLDILRSFDLTVCKALLAEWPYIIHHPDAGGLNAKILLVNNPMKEVMRVMKYHKRGVIFDPFCLLKIFKAWDQMTPAQKQQTFDFYDPPLVEDDEDDYPEDYGSFDDHFFSE